MFYFTKKLSKEATGMNFLIGYLTGYGYLFAIILGIGFCHKKLGLPSELSRKLIHILICFTWLVLYKFFAGSWQILVMPVSFVIINALSLKYRFFAGMEREGEKSTPGTVYYALAITILMALSLIFPQTLVPSGVAVFSLSFGDGFAAIAGHYFGKSSIKLTKTKTLVGTAACFVFTMIGIGILACFVPHGLTLWQIGVIALAASALELVGYGLDNFTVTLGVTALATLFCEVL